MDIAYWQMYHIEWYHRSYSLAAEYKLLCRKLNGTAIVPSPHRIDSIINLLYAHHQSCFSPLDDSIMPKMQHIYDDNSAYTTAAHQFHVCPLSALPMGKRPKLDKLPVIGCDLNRTYIIWLLIDFAGIIIRAVNLYINFPLTFAASRTVCSINTIKIAQATSEKAIR